MFLKKLVEFSILAPPSCPDPTIPSNGCCPPHNQKEPRHGAVFVLFACISPSRVALNLQHFVFPGSDAVVRPTSQNTSPKPPNLALPPFKNCLIGLTALGGNSTPTQSKCLPNSVQLVQLRLPLPLPLALAGLGRRRMD